MLEALRYAGNTGLLTVAMTEERWTAELDEVCEYILGVPSAITPRIQEAHIFLGHLMAEFVERQLFSHE